MTSARSCPVDRVAVVGELQVSETVVWRKL